MSQIYDLLREYGWPRNNPYSFEEFSKKFAEFGVVLSDKAFEIAVQFDDLVGTFCSFHQNVHFDVVGFLPDYEGCGVSETSRIVGKDLIPIASDSDGYIWLVASDGSIYTDWSGIVCLQGDNIISALEGAMNRYEGIRLDSPE